MSVEIGWVIEGAWSPTSAPDYWIGSSAWSPDPDKALRFARCQDAEQAADLMCDGLSVRICCHEWDTRTATPVQISAEAAGTQDSSAANQPIGIVTMSEPFDESANRVTVSDDSAADQPSPAHVHTFTMGVCACGERSDAYLYY